MATGNIRKLGKNKFLITIDRGYHPDTKVRDRSSVTFHGSETEAKNEQARLLQNQNGWSDINPNKTSVSAYIKMWLEAAETMLAKSTMRRYKQILELRIDKKLGQHYLSKITPQHVQAFFDSLAKENTLTKSNKPLSQESIDYHYRVLHVLFESVKKKDLILRNPCDFIELPKSTKPFDEEDESDTEVYTPAQVKQLVLSLEGVRKVLISTAVKTGLRRGELLALQWKDVDLKAYRLSVKRALYYSKTEGYSYKAPKTKKSRRTIDISKELAEELKHWQNEQNKIKLRLGENYVKEDLIFDNGDGNWMNPDSVSSWFPDHAEKLKLPRHNFHVLRHTHASILLAAGVDIKKISERLGHSSVRITYDIYSHLMPDHGKDLVKRMESALK